MVHLPIFAISTIVMPYTIWYQMQQISILLQKSARNCSSMVWRSTVLTNLVELLSFIVLLRLEGKSMDNLMKLLTIRYKFCRNWLIVRKLISILWIIITKLLCITLVRKNSSFPYCTCWIPTSTTMWRILKEIHPWPSAWNIGCSIRRPFW